MYNCISLCDVKEHVPITHSKIELNFWRVPMRAIPIIVIIIAIIIIFFLYIGYIVTMRKNIYLLKILVLRNAICTTQLN